MLPLEAVRPSKFMAAIADGLNTQQACMAVGIGETTFMIGAKNTLTWNTLVKKSRRRQIVARR
jgi:hypothetical protein